MISASKTTYILLNLNILGIKNIKSNKFAFKTFVKVTPAKIIGDKVYSNDNYNKISFNFFLHII